MLRIELRKVLQVGERLVHPSLHGGGLHTAHLRLLLFLVHRMTRNRDLRYDLGDVHIEDDRFLKFLHL